MLRPTLSKLCSKNEYTKSESNSQQMGKLWRRLTDCVQRTNIQNLKAIHNLSRRKKTVLLLCSKNEYTKSESNSQPDQLHRVFQNNCVQRTNIQNLKAIHNGKGRQPWSSLLCSKNEYTKSESNSQPVSRVGRYASYCVQRTNIQNLKAIHNQPWFICRLCPIVFKERIYKI